MLLHVKQVLDADELREARAILKRATWGDGRVIAGVQSARTKNYEQLTQTSAENQALQQIVLGGLNRHAVFFSAALPRKVFPPLFNRYDGAADSFGNHVDNAVRGRVMALWIMGFGGAVGIGALAWGPVAHHSIGDVGDGHLGSWGYPVGGMGAV